MAPIQRLQLRLRKVEERVETLDQKMEREHQHIFRVIVTQRENIQQAFSQINMALLEQEMQYRAMMALTKESFAELKSSLAEATSSIQDLAQLFEDHERRLRRLEEGPPPTA